MKLKEFIKQQFLIQYKKNIGLNSVKLKRRWFIKNGYETFYNEIFKRTTFLSKDSSIGERIYCILHNIKKILKCKKCKQKRTFSSFVEGYRISCGNPKCYLFLKINLKDKNGLNSYQRSGVGISKARRKIIKNGKTVAQLSALKTHKYLRNTIDSKTGKSLIQLMMDKIAYRNTHTILSNGMTLAKDIAKRAAETRRNTIVSSEGKTAEQLRIERVMNTKSKIDPKTGLDLYEKAFLHGAGRSSSIKYYNDKLFFQGTFEKHFLDEMSEYKILEFIKRGERFKYEYRKKLKQYRSDFMINNIVFEIKSIWSYCGRPDFLEINNLKFKSVINAGFKLIVIFDKKYWVTIPQHFEIIRSFYPYTKRQQTIAIKNKEKILQQIRQQI